jgi:membrane protease YdiL (CAAX protease family)
MEPSSPNITNKQHRSLLARIFVSADESRLRLLWRLVGQSALMFLSLALLGIPIGIFFALMPSTSLDVVLIPGLLVELLAITLSVFLARKYFDRRSFVSLGLRIDPQAGRDLLFGLLFAAVLMALVYLTEWAFGWLVFESFTWSTQSLSQIVVGILTVAFTHIIVGWSEELLSRGYWLQNITDGLNVFWGVLISSSIFGLAHLGNPNWSWIAVINITINGFLLAFAYLRTRQLWLPIGLHIGWNFFEGAVFGFPVSGFDSFVLIRQTVQGPELFTGGAFGPEAGLINLPIIALGVALVYWYTRDKSQVKEQPVPVFTDPEST